MTTTLPAVPEWLSLRDGALKPGIRDHILFVMLSGQPQYRVEAKPADGKYVAQVTQTVNGKQLGDGTTYATRDAALFGGLEQLKNKLGW